MIARVLERTGATLHAWEEICKEVAQLVLLYGINSWVVTGKILKFLTAFHHKAAQRITGMTEKRGSGGEWEYPVAYEEMNSAGIHPI